MDRSSLQTWLREAPARVPIVGGVGLFVLFRPVRKAVLWLIAAVVLLEWLFNWLGNPFGDD
jgi:hypothetical protein